MAFNNYVFTFGFKALKKKETNHIILHAALHLCGPDREMSLLF